MTTTAFALGKLRPAASRGGDCRAHDLARGYDIYGAGHRFASTTHCRIENGLMRLDVGVEDESPSMAVSVWRGRIAVEDYFSDTFSDTFPGVIGTPEWIEMGTIVIDSSLVTTLLTAVRIVRCNPERVTIRLVAPVGASAFVTLRRGERMARIQHGNTRGVPVTTSRRVRWTDTPNPTPYYSTKRVEELAPATGNDGLFRFVSTLDTATVTDGTFSRTVLGSRSARFGAGVGTASPDDRPIDMHRQLRDASRPRLAVV